MDNLAAARLTSLLSYLTTGFTQALDGVIEAVLAERNCPKFFALPGQFFTWLVRYFALGIF